MKVVRILCIVLLLASVVSFCSVAGYAPNLTDGQKTQAVSSLVWIIGLIVALVFVRMNEARAPRDTFGSAHFAEGQALQSAGLTARGNDPGLMLGVTKDKQYIAIPEHLQREHVMLVAPTGMGKTSGVIIPGLLTEQGQRGLFINDVKGELYEKCAGYLARRFPVVQLFAPTRPGESIHYNPLVHIASMEDAEDFAISWVDNTGVSDEPYWNETAKLLITAVVLHLRGVEPQAPLSRLADILSSSSVDQIRQLLTQSKSDLARDIGKSFINNLAQDPKLAGSILSGMATRFMTLKNPTIRALTSIHPDSAVNVDFARLAGQPAALFLSIPPSDSRRLRPLIACLVMQLMMFLTRRGSGARPFALYLDELANAGKIPHYAEHISLVRGQGLALIQAIQDFGQLKRVYGEDDAATILANSTTKIFYPGVGKDEAEYASALVGDTTVMNESVTQQGLKIAGTTGWAQRRLMTPDEIRRMMIGELLIISKNVAPVKVWNVPYFQRRELAELTTLPAPNTATQITTHPLPLQQPPQQLGPLQLPPIRP